MKEKQQISKEIRRTIAELNEKIAELTDSETKDMPNSTLNVMSPAVLFDDRCDDYDELKNKISELIGECSTCKALLKDNSPIIEEYNNCIEKLQQLRSYIEQNIK